MLVTIYKNTNFGNNDLVWNIPHPNYNFNQHTNQTFSNVNMRFPLLTTRIVVQGSYDFNTAFYDYMIITNDDNTKTYYFINSIIAERNILLFSVTLDAITTHNILSLPITGVITRKHDTNPNETKFDYPTALNFTGNFQHETYEFVGYNANNTRFIESAVNLSNVDLSQTIPSTTGESITIPVLGKPTHNTDYEITPWGGGHIKDDSRALTLYLADNVSSNVIDTVRGLSGDGAISDSYVIPNEAIDITANGAEVSLVRGKFLIKTLGLKLEIDYNSLGYTPINEAIKGMFSVAIMSIQEKTRITFPAWDLWQSVDGSNHIQVNLWCDPKPSGTPFCCPTQVATLDPNGDDIAIRLATLEAKSVKGGQWLRNPLIYTTGRGELFSTIETQLQRERADYEQQVSLHQLELSRREREIRIAQSDYNYQSGLASSIISGGASILSGDFGGAFNQAKGAIDSTVNQQFLEQMRNLQSYEQETEKTLISMAYSNNLKNLNVAETIRRITPREVVFEPNESLGSFERYNGFTVSVIRPDIDSLKAKDMEYCKYGYPVYEAVKNFVMLNNLRQKHTVFQFDSPTLDIGGKHGDMIREVLQAGIRILSQPYSQANLINNPK